MNWNKITLRRILRIIKKFFLFIITIIFLMIAISWIKWRFDSRREFCEMIINNPCVILNLPETDVNYKAYNYFDWLDEYYEHKHYLINALIISDGDISGLNFFNKQIWIFDSYNGVEYPDNNFYVYEFYSNKKDLFFYVEFYFIGDSLYTIEFGRTYDVVTSDDIDIPVDTLLCE